MSKWNHSQCWHCWREKNTSDDNMVRLPARMVHLSPGETDLDLERVCCFCSRLTIEGIFVRGNPDETPCGGQGYSHRDDDE